MVSLPYEHLVCLSDMFKDWDNKMTQFPLQGSSI